MLETLAAGSVLAADSTGDRAVDDVTAEARLPEQFARARIERVEVAFAPARELVPRRLVTTRRPLRCRAYLSFEKLVGVRNTLTMWSTIGPSRCVSSATCRQSGSALNAAQLASAAARSLWASI